MYDKYTTIIKKDYPDLEINSFELLGEGWNNIAFLANGELIFRFAKVEEAVQAINGENALLRLLQDVSPIPIPSPGYYSREHAYMGYQVVAGTPLLQVRDQFQLNEWPQFAETISQFLTAINAVPLDQVRGLIEEDLDSPESWLEEARQEYAQVKHVIPAEKVAAIEEFFAAPLPVECPTPAFAHNDLGVEHIIVDPAAREVKGVIDWGDAAIADPAYDLGMIFRDLGDEALAAVLCHYRSNEPAEALRKRAVFYARCTVFEDIAYGLESGRDEYVQKSLTSLDWLF